PPAVHRLLLRSNHLQLLVPRGQCPVPSVFPHHYLSAPQISGRTFPGISARAPRPAGRTRRCPSRCSLPAQNQTSLPAPPPCSNRRPVLHQNHLALLQSVPSFPRAIPPEIYPAANDP